MYSLAIGCKLNTPLRESASQLKRANGLLLQCCSKSHAYVPYWTLTVGCYNSTAYRIFETHKLVFKLFLVKAISSLIFVVDLNARLVRYQFRRQVSTNYRKGGFFSASLGRQHFTKASSVHCHYRKYWSNLIVMFPVVVNQVFSNEQPQELPSPIIAALTGWQSNEPIRTRGNSCRRH